MNTQAPGATACRQPQTRPPHAQNPSCRVPEPALFNVRLSDLVCGPGLEMILSLNWCSR